MWLVKQSVSQKNIHKSTTIVQSLLYHNFQRNLSSTSAYVNTIDRVPDKFVSLAHDLADLSGAIATSLFKTTVGVDVKPDFSPVTIADRSAEEAMRRLIHDTFEDHTVFGEESGLTLSKHSYQHRSLSPLGSHLDMENEKESEWKWVLDPIDGTKSFVTGKPLFGTLISLVHINDGPVLGMVNMPALGERWVGGRGLESTFNGTKVNVRKCSALSKAVLYGPNPKFRTRPQQQAFNGVRDSVAFTVYGGDCYPYGLLSSGFCDIVLEGELKPWDYLALVPLIEGAGGLVTDWEGKTLTEKSDGLVLACGSKKLHEEALHILSQKE